MTRQRGTAATDSGRGDTPEAASGFSAAGSFGSLQSGKQQNGERGRSIGERASDGAVTVTTSHGGKRSKGSSACGECRVVCGFIPWTHRHETRRTPWSVAGCNKPAKRRAVNPSKL